MKIVLPYNTFPGGFLLSIEKALRVMGHQILVLKRYKPSLLNRIARKTKFTPIETAAIAQKEKEFNAEYLKQVLDYKPDIYLNYSGGNVFPSTIKKIKENSNCLMVCYIADNPCDPDPRRDQYFPMTLQYYDIFLNPEPVWDKLIKNLCEKPKIIRFYGGYDPENFYAIDGESITLHERAELECDVSFTGGSYNKSAEGAYRSGILNHLDGYNIKVWGDKGWKYRFNFMPQIKPAYQGERLSYDKLRKLYSLSRINLNMPSPQIFTSFQPRVFDIAATKGFQIIDHSDYLSGIFKGINIQTFKSIAELKEKIDYYLRNPNEREQIVEEMYNVVKNDYTWENQTRVLLAKIL